MEAAKAVLVTGASSGIGRRLTERLAAHGHIVYACARKASDLDALAALQNVRPLHLDVTSSADIERAVRTIEDSECGLYGLVNNAGVVTLGPVINGDLAEFDLIMQVNVYGPYLMTQAFAGLIAAARGRIVMISSVAGILAQSNVSAYSMSKHAIEAFADCLACEMEPLGVHVSVVEPGSYCSEIGRNAARRVADNPWLPDFSAFKDCTEVAVGIEAALFDPYPKHRYLVVPDEREAEITIRKQISQLVQLNEGQRYSYDRATLIRMMDEPLALARPRTAQ